MLGSLQAQAGASAASQLSTHRQHGPQCRPVARLCRACSSFGAGQLGQQGIPPRLTSFVQRSIIRTESFGGTAPVEEQPSKVGPLKVGPLPAAFTEKYLLRKLLGRGSFGTVRSAVDKETGLERAAKLLPKDRAGKERERVLAHLREEVEILRDLQGIPEVLQLHEVFEDENTLCIVTEVCYGGDLEQLIQERGYLTEPEAAMVIHAVLAVLAACHNRGICYGDIKPANFLLKWPFPSIADPQALPDIRIADFGCAQQLQEGSKKKPGGTPLYTAPEQFMQTVGLESDMWALGMLMYQLLCGRLPFADSFSGQSAMDLMMAILSEDVKFEGPRWGCISQGARSLIMRMLDRDYNSRVTAADALLDPWITRLCHVDDYSGSFNRCLVDDSPQPPRKCSAGF